MQTIKSNNLFGSNRGKWIFFLHQILFCAFNALILYSPTFFKVPFGGFVFPKHYNWIDNLYQNILCSPWNDQGSSNYTSMVKVGLLLDLLCILEHTMFSLE